MADPNTADFFDVPVENAASLESQLGSVLTLGHVLTGVGADHDSPVHIEDVHVIRHSFKPDGHDGLQGPEDLTEERVIDYTRSQSISTRRFPADTPRYWVVLSADGQRRSRRPR